MGLVQKNKIKPIRLKGAAMSALRREVYERDGGCCVVCGRWVPLEGGLWERAHLAHIKSRGAGGGDVIDNVQIKCAECHLNREHGPRWSRRA